MSAAAIAVPTTPTAPIGIAQVAAWLEPNARLAWQNAVLSDPDLPAGAIKLAWKLFTHCLGVPRWRITVAQLGEEVGLSRSTAFTSFHDLEEFGYARHSEDGKFLEIIPVGQRSRQSGNPDSRSPEIRTPTAPAIAMGNTMVRAHAPVVEENINNQEKTTTRALPVTDDPNCSSLEAEKIKTALIERKVAPREARKLAQSVPPTEAEQSIAVADDYARNQEKSIKNQAGLYVAAVRGRWKPAGPPPRPAPVVAASLPNCPVCAAEMSPYECLVVGDAGLMHGRCGGER